MKRDDKKSGEMVQKLIFWFVTNKRDLPWRKKHSPYETWIAEVMLQQTQVKTVLPYFQRWMKRFPDTLSVAEASEEEILKHWEGLGYYSRAENIQKTARIVVQDFEGEFPKDHQTILKLPGIGPYTAGAIMSLAYNKEHPIVDGNVERVFSRVFNIRKPVKEKESQAFIWNMARKLIPKGKARDFNQALMELGALICLPRNPLCSQCPIHSFCESYRLGLVDQRPVPRQRKVITPLEVALGVLVNDGKVLIQKRPPSGLMANLWEFPGGKLKDGETPKETLLREFAEELELKIHCSKKITVIRHSYTSFRVTLHAFFCQLQDPNQTPVLHAAVDARWVKPGQLSQYAFPSANRKLITLIERKGLPTAS
jgi:A/G-specific adenine glycosylase